MKLPVPEHEVHPVADGEPAAGLAHESPDGQVEPPEGGTSVPTDAVGSSGHLPMAETVAERPTAHDGGSPGAAADQHAAESAAKFRKSQE